MRSVASGESLCGPGGGGGGGEPLCTAGVVGRPGVWQGQEQGQHWETGVKESDGESVRSTPTGVPPPPLLRHWHLVPACLRSCPTPSTPQRGLVNGGGPPWSAAGVQSPVTGPGHRLLQCSHGVGCKHLRRETGGRGAEFFRGRRQFFKLVGAPAPPPPAGMKINATPWGGGAGGASLLNPPVNPKLSPRATP